MRASPARITKEFGNSWQRIHSPSFSISNPSIINFEALFINHALLKKKKKEKKKEIGFRAYLGNWNLFPL